MMDAFPITITHRAIRDPWSMPTFCHRKNLPTQLCIMPPLERALDPPPRDRTDDRNVRPGTVLLLLLLLRDALGAGTASRSLATAAPSGIWSAYHHIISYIRNCFTRFLSTSFEEQSCP